MTSLFKTRVVAAALCATLGLMTLSACGGHSHSHSHTGHSSSVATQKPTTVHHIHHIVVHTPKKAKKAKKAKAKKH